MTVDESSAPEEDAREEDAREEDAPADETHEETGSERVASAFTRTVEEGRSRLGRTWPALLATGTIGGFDVGIGLLALFIVRDETGSPMLGALAFTIGFIALSLANSELFTEDFLVPLSAMTADKTGPVPVLRLWAGTATMNLAGGWLMMALVVIGRPEIGHVAVAMGTERLAPGLGTESFASAVLAGMAITLMTWMEHSTEAIVGKLAAVISIGFLLVAASLDHAIVISLELFAALQAGAPFGYGDWAGLLGWAVLGNAVGGIGLVTVVRFVQVGRHRIHVEQAKQAAS